MSNLKLLTLKEAAEITGRTYQELWKLCNAGKIRHHRKGVNCTGAYLVRLEWIEEYIESTSVEPKVTKKRATATPALSIHKPKGKPSSGEFVGFSKLVDQIKVG